MSQNYINHVVLVLDASSSMTGHTRDLVKVADAQVKYLAQRSQELDQETRVSVYTFANTVQCLVYDKDVLRLPSISSLYRASGMTALIDASVKSIEDLEQTATLYGDHAFLVWVLTDGMENASKLKPQMLRAKLAGLPDNWTVGVLVPDQRGVFEAKGFGFAPDNISVWNPNDTGAVLEVGNTVRTATDNWMNARSTGVRGTRSLFSTGLDAVNRTTVSSSLKALPLTSYAVVPVSFERQIRDAVESSGNFGRYQTGKSFYQLTKTETIQPHKQVVIREKSTGKVYSGSQARSLIGLPAHEVRVKPDANPEYDIFVQSTSVNRKVLPGTDVLVLK
jgi:hypothetical protein